MFAWVLILYLCFYKCLGKDEKIFGGRAAEEGEFPFVIAIQGSKHCAGSLVTMDKIVTAAVCIATEWRNQKVIAGVLIRKEQIDDKQVRRMKSIHIHEKYLKIKYTETNEASRDVATAILKSPFNLSKEVQPMKIVSANPRKFRNLWDGVVQSKTICYSVGWGATEDGYNPKTRRYDPIGESVAYWLKVIKVEPWDDIRCIRSRQSNAATKMGGVCVMGLIPGESPCAGDNGSPLICNGYAYGLFSKYRGRCGGLKYPFLYILFDQYIDYFDLGVTASDLACRSSGQKSSKITFVILFSTFVIVIIKLL